eukprot:gnl/MRDRNA2_/MRDRNA2_86977_c0_seq1.p1 gnl/MRDRNA2_/MRDRNA2_86977_c0~~gnl/MRDRNA2_/MRDRNA2_86977_c0_seq1.p1  ORF type:complete len:190 (+),score=21.15 gnl/MRDRNA2_/MRDRNA2_86977_c0_seq1:96-665(+)
MVRHDSGAHGVYHTGHSLTFCRCSKCSRRRQEAVRDPENAGKTTKQMVWEGHFGIQNDSRRRSWRYKGELTMNSEYYTALARSEGAEIEKEDNRALTEPLSHQKTVSRALEPAQTTPRAQVSFGDFMPAARIVTRPHKIVAACLRGTVDTAAPVVMPTPATPAAVTWPAPRLETAVPSPVAQSDEWTLL